MITLWTWRSTYGLVSTGLVCIAAVGLSLGCSRAHGTEAASNSLIIVAVDRSGSTDKIRAAQLNQLDVVTTSALANNSLLEVWTFDRKGVCIWGPRIPNSRDALTVVKSKELAPVDSPQRHITRPALLLEAISQDPTFLKASNIKVVLLTDGDAEDANDRARFVSVAKTLSQRPGIQVSVIGIRPEARQDWESAFVPVLHDRFHLAGPSEADAALAEMLR